MIIAYLCAITLAVLRTRSHVNASCAKMGSDKAETKRRFFNEVLIEECLSGRVCHHCRRVEEENCRTLQNSSSERRVACRKPANHGTSHDGIREQSV